MGPHSSARSSACCCGCRGICTDVSPARCHVGTAADGPAPDLRSPRPRSKPHLLAPLLGPSISAGPPRCSLTRGHGGPFSIIHDHDGRLLVPEILRDVGEDCHVPEDAKQSETLLVTLSV